MRWASASEGFTPTVFTVPPSQLMMDDSQLDRGGVGVGGDPLLGPPSASSSPPTSSHVDPSALACGLANCSGNGECRQGSCYCMVQFEGNECQQINFYYHVAFASIFYLLALTSLIQLAMCIHAEYLRMKKNPSVLRACRITTQKFLYFLVFLASILRGTYFAAPTVGKEISTSLLSAYYPVVLTSASLIVCFWAEVFHLREIRWDRPRFLSKSFLGFLAFNVISYSLLLAELFLVWRPSDQTETDDEAQGGAGVGVSDTEWASSDDFYIAHVFNGCYAFLMFVVVIFFLIYGVEVFFKVRGGFTFSRQSTVTASAVISGRPAMDPVTALDGGLIEGKEERRQKRKRRRQNLQDETSSKQNPMSASSQTNELTKEMLLLNQPTCDVPTNTVPKIDNYEQNSQDSPSQGLAPSTLEEAISVGGYPGATSAPHVIASTTSQPTAQSTISTNLPCSPAVDVNTSQLHQSRFGLLSQAVMMIMTVGFMFSETLEQFWKTKVDLTSRNTHDIIFRTIEIGVALWFPCVLWNCIRPEQLWCLNPKKILDRRWNNKKTKAESSSSATEGTPSGDLLKPPRHKRDSSLGESTCSTTSTSSETTTDEDDDKGPECWICYDPDRCDAGPMIRPCDCRGDVSAVHHDCLRRWLVESADNPDALKCKVCSAEYMVEKGSQFSLANGFTAKQWMQTASMVTMICLATGGAWAVIQIYSEPWIRILAVGGACFIIYICLRFLGLNTLTAYQRARVSALKIVNLRMGGNRSGGNNQLIVTPLSSNNRETPIHHARISTIQVEFEPTTRRASTTSSVINLSAQTRI